MMRIRLAEHFLELSKKDLRVPNGIGCWSVDSNGKIYPEGLFLMYIDEIKPPQKNIHEIKGVIYDQLGKAIFQGSFGVDPLNFIEFVKEYDLEASGRTSPESKSPATFKYRGYQMTGDKTYGNLYEGNFARSGEPYEGSNLRFLLRLKV